MDIHYVLLKNTIAPQPKQQNVAGSIAYLNEQDLLDKQAMLEEQN